LGSEVPLRIEILSADSFATKDLLRTPEHTWSTRRYRLVALRQTQMWGITKDGYGYHNLPPTPQSWGMRQMKVTSSLDTTSTLLVTILALARNFYLYQVSSTRASAMEMDNEPASK
jgi:hypothetical protein